MSNEQAMNAVRDKCADLIDEYYDDDAPDNDQPVEVRRLRDVASIVCAIRDGAITEQQLEDWKTTHARRH